MLRDARGSRRVIVVLRSQHRALPATKRLVAARVRAVKAEQAPLVAQVARSGGRVSHQYTVLNGFSARVSGAEVAKLSANRSVAKVVPDAVIRLPKPVSTRTLAHSAAGPTAPNGTPVAGTCPSDPSKPLLEPEALQTTHTAFSDPSTPQAQSLATGAGVKVAFFADGLDPNNPDFIRPDGSHVFIDYQDFSGDGPNAVTGAAEAFGDASSIAAQGRQVYDLSKFNVPQHPLPAGCNIRVRGISPGASLIGMKVFGNSSSLVRLDDPPGARLRGHARPRRRAQRVLRRLPDPGHGAGPHAPVQLAGRRPPASPWSRAPATPAWSRARAPPPATRP